MMTIEFQTDGFAVVAGDVGNPCQFCGARPAEKHPFEVSNVHVLRRLGVPVGKRLLVTGSLCAKCSNRPRIQAETEAYVLRLNAA